MTKFICTTKSHSNQIREKVEIKQIKNAKVFIDYSQTTDDVYGNLEDYNPTKKRKVLIVFDYMIADMEAKIILSPILMNCFLRGRKLTVSLTYYIKVIKFSKCKKL